MSKYTIQWRIALWHLNDHEILEAIKQEDLYPEDKYLVKDTEKYDTLVAALKRWHDVTHVAPYHPVEEREYIVLQWEGFTMLDEQEQYSRAEKT